MRADGHYKAYINPCLEAFNCADLGFNIGPISVGATCRADDTYILSVNPSGLQSALNIASHYARRYHVTFNASKTKVVVTGSKQDMNFYQKTKPWTLNGVRISVVENNDHLGLVVSGWDEEQKNLDQNITKCRNSLFALLGSTYAYMCKISHPSSPLAYLQPPSSNYRSQCSALQAKSHDLSNLLSPQDSAQFPVSTFSLASYHLSVNCTLMSSHCFTMSG